MTVTLVSVSSCKLTQIISHEDKVEEQVKGGSFLLML